MFFAVWTSLVLCVFGSRDRHARFAETRARFADEQRVHRLDTLLRELRAVGEMDDRDFSYRAKRTVWIPHEGRSTPEECDALEDIYPDNVCETLVSHDGCKNADSVTDNIQANCAKSCCELELPVRLPTDEPTLEPSESPTEAPSESPTEAPSESPTEAEPPTEPPTCPEIVNCAVDEICESAEDPSTCPQCNIGFYGDSCTECSSINHCIGDITCTDEADSVCSECEQPYSGDTCTIASIGTPSPVEPVPPSPSPAPQPVMPDCSTDAGKELACLAAAQALAPGLGLTMGGEGYAFAGDWKGGCYYYKHGKYEGHAYFGARGDDKLKPDQERIPNQCDCSTEERKIEECQITALAMGLTLGGLGYEFEGNYGGGCYYYDKGYYEGKAYYGKGGGEPGKGQKKLKTFCGDDKPGPPKPPCPPGPHGPHHPSHSSSSEDCGPPDGGPHPPHPPHEHPPHEHPPHEHDRPGRFECVDNTDALQAAVYDNTATCATVFKMYGGKAVVCAYPHLADHCCASCNTARSMDSVARLLDELEGLLDERENTKYGGSMPFPAEAYF